MTQREQTGSTDAQPQVAGELAAIEAEGRDKLEAAASLEELRTVEASVLGRKSAIARLNAALAALAPEARRELGQALNAAREGLAAIARSRAASAGGPGAGPADRRGAPRPDRGRRDGRLPAGCPTTATSTW